MQSKEAIQRRLDGIDYDDFVKKFEQKKTTDDCYTPEPIYDVIAEYVERKYKVSRDHFVRPFYPGGDYEHYDYKDGDIVVDNPPFSIIAHIEDFYTLNGIKFFLFCPGLTSMRRGGIFHGVPVTLIAADADITYENGANVRTGFLTNLETEYIVRTDVELYKAIKKADEEIRKETRKELRKYVFPDNVITQAKMNFLTNHGIDFAVPHGCGMMKGSLDACGSDHKKVSIFGGGYIVIDEIAAEKAAAEKAAAEKAAAEKAAAETAAEKYELSEKEKEALKYIEQRWKK